MKGVLEAVGGQVYRCQRLASSIVAMEEMYVGKAQAVRK